MKTESTKTERISRIVLALLVGVLIWGAAIDSEVFSVDVKFPLHLVTEDSFVVSDVSRDTLTVKLTGSGLELLSYQISSPPAGIERSVQVTGITSFPASATIELNASNIRIRGSVTVSQIAPGQVSFTVDTVITRRLPVAVLSSDAVPCRFRLMSVEPEYITVTGPSSMVLSWDSVATEPVELSSGEMTASLALHNDMVAYSEGSVRVRTYEPSVPVIDFDTGSSGH